MQRSTTITIRTESCSPRPTHVNLLKLERHLQDPPWSRITGTQGKLRTAISHCNFDQPENSNKRPEGWLSTRVPLTKIDFWATWITITYLWGLRVKIKVYALQCEFSETKHNHTGRVCSDDITISHKTWKGLRHMWHTAYAKILTRALARTPREDVTAMKPKRSRQLLARKRAIQEISGRDWEDHESRSTLYLKGKAFGYRTQAQTQTQNKQTYHIKNGHQAVYQPQWWLVHRTVVDGLVNKRKNISALWFGRESISSSAHHFERLALGRRSASVWFPPVGRCDSLTDYSAVILSVEVRPTGACTGRPMIPTTECFRLINKTAVLKVFLWCIKKAYSTGRS